MKKLEDFNSDKFRLTNEDNIVGGTHIEYSFESYYTHSSSGQTFTDLKVVDICLYT